MKPLLVGELNPYGADPAFALYPFPEHSAGGRMCRLVLGMRPREYLAAFDRTNLCSGWWHLKMAKAEAAEIAQRREGELLVLLGSKVCAAFGVPFMPFTAHPGYWQRMVILPHPSGRCRIWNDPKAVDEAKSVLRKEGALP